MSRRYQRSYCLNRMSSSRCCWNRTYQCWRNRSCLSWTSCCPSRTNQNQCFHCRMYLCYGPTSQEYHHWNLRSLQSCYRIRTNQIRCFRYHSCLCCVLMILEYRRLRIRRNRWMCCHDQMSRRYQKNHCSLGLKSHMYQKSHCFLGPRSRTCQTSHCYLVLMNRRYRMRWCYHCCRNQSPRCGLSMIRMNQSRCYQTTRCMLANILRRSVPVVCGREE